MLQPAADLGGLRTGGFTLWRPARTPQLTTTSPSAPATTSNSSLCYTTSGKYILYTGCPKKNALSESSSCKLTRQRDPPRLLGACKPGLWAWMDCRTAMMILKVRFLGHPVSKAKTMCKTGFGSQGVILDGFQTSFL